MKKAENQDLDFVLLPDRPIEADEEEQLKFGHKDIKQTLISIIKKVETPFTIGLYGRWGSGKTSIAKGIREEFQKGNFRCLYFDAWKYERDSLRRQFLIEIDNQIFNKSIGFVKKLNQSLTEYKVPDIKNFFKQILFQILIIFIIVIILLGVYIFFKEENKSYIDILNIIKEAGLLSVIISFLLSYFSIAKDTIHTNRTDSAEGFEKHFFDCLKKQKLKDKRFVIIIDNLDRLEDDKAVEVLSDIKTFLIKEDDKTHDLVFLIPCDDSALRAQLLNKFGESFDANEFLRKFFNLTLRVPKFIDIELFTYVKDLLKETKLEELEGNLKLQEIIVNSLRDNPREIKQFINSLIPLILLCKKRGLDDVLKNIPFLAKLLLLRQKFPLAYNIIEEKSLKSNKGLREEEDIKELIEDYKKELIIKRKLSNEDGDTNKWVEEEVAKLKEFVQNYKGIHPEYIDIFISLRPVGEIPEWSSYDTSCQEGNEDAANRIFADIKKKNKTEDLDEMLRSHTIKYSGTSVFSPFVSTTLKLINKHNLFDKFKLFLEALAEEFHKHRDILENDFSDFDPDVIFSKWYPKISASQQNNLTKPFIDLLSTNFGKKDSQKRDYLTKVLKNINKHKDIFSPFSKTIKDMLKNNAYYEYPFILEFTNADSRKLFLTEELKALFIDTLQAENIQDSQRLVDFWNEIKLEDKGTRENSFKKFRELLQYFVDTNSDVNEALKLVSGLLIFSTKNKDLLEAENISEPLQNEIENISKILNQCYDLIPKEERGKIIGAIGFYHCLKNNKTNILGARISDFLENSGFDEIKDIKKEKIQEWVKKEPSAVVRRSSSNHDIFIHFKLGDVLDKDKVQGIVSNCVDRGGNPSELLKSINYNIPSPAPIIQNLIERINDFDLDNLDSIIITLKKLGIKGDPTRIEDLYNKLLVFREKPGVDIKKLETIINKHKKELFNKAQIISLLKK